MGNRANIIFTDGAQFSPCIYLHWNGSPSSVYAFLSELDRRGVRADQNYECAQFIALVGEFFNAKDISGTSLGIVSLDKNISHKNLHDIYTDPGDNGFYLVNRTDKSRMVRRFIDDYESNSVKEMRAIDVVKEYAEAIRDEKYTGIRETFLELTKDKTIASEPITAKWKMETALNKMGERKAKKAKKAMIRDFQASLNTIEATPWF